ncbi:PAS domain S-box protein [Methanoregula sp.]|uniref:PAS domain S-box protein n=1 Tax=Methanoregula sp. TaxID=2052170 RepID=UPI003568A12A
MISLLYVDDEPDLLEIARLFLERSGEFRVGTSTSAHDALASPSFRSYDAILSDYQMPDMDGIAFLKEVRERFGDIPFILFTGRGREEVVIEAINNGADFYLQKGGDPRAQFAELAHKIRHAVARRQVNEELRAAYEQLTASEEELRGQYQELALGERRIRESEEMYRTMIEHSRDGFFILQDGGLVFYNRGAFAALTGYDENELIGKSIADIVAPEDRKKAQQRYQQRLAGEAIPDSVEYTLLHKDGQTRAHIILHASMGMYRGRPALMGTIREITADRMRENALRESRDELIQKNQELRASEEMFRVLVEHSLDGILITDLNGILLFTNRAAGLIIDDPDYSAKIGKKNVLEYVAPESQENLQRDFSNIVQGVNAYLVLYKLITETKREIWIECIGKKIRFQKTDAVFISFRDVTERKWAEERERESGKKFATVFKSSPVALTLASAADGKFVDVNEAFLKETGYSREDVIGKTAEELQLFPDNSERGRMISCLRSRQDIHGMEMSCLIKTGEIRTCLFSSSLILMDGKPHILSTIEDITERKKAEEELRKNRQLLGEAMDMAHLANWEHDLSTNMFTFDNRFYTLYGTTAEREGGNQMTTETYTRKFVHPEDQGVVADEARKAIQAADPHYTSQREHRIIRRDGEIRHIVVRIGITKDAEGRTIKTHGANQDITERKKAEAAVRESEEKFRSLVETSPDIVWEVDVQGRFLYISPMFETIMGYPAERWIGKRITDLTTDVGCSFARQELSRLAASDGPCVPFEIPIHNSSGREMIIEIRPARVTDADGNLIGFRGVAIDITERKNAELALRRANRQLTLLTGITRHDILNKITVILGYLKMAEKECTIPLQADHLGKVRTAITMIRSQIEFTRIYQNLGTHEPQWITLVEVIPRSQVPDPIALITDIRGVQVFADPMLEKVFSNLLDNTIHHGERVTEIQVSSRRERQDLVIVWEDNGIGIAADEKEQVFERGFGKNTGLGLFLVREILSLTDITITETGEPRAGARFEIRVPVDMWRMTGERR